MLPTSSDLEIRFPAMRRVAARNEFGEHQRLAMELWRARRVQRWAERLDRLSQRMSRTAYLRLAKLP